MKILILNWRDPKNPEAGGAEQITQKYAKYWQAKGHEIYWLSNLFPGAKSEEAVDDLRYERVGPVLSRNTIKNFLAYPIYLLKSVFRARRLIEQENVDVVIDEIHGLPFFSPLFSKKRNILLVCEVAGPIWDKMWPFPVNKVGKLLEKLVYFIYRNAEIWAISQNTRQDILNLNPNLTVKILPLGIDIHKPAIARSRNLSKYKHPAAVFLARLVKMKGIESAILVAELITNNLPNFKLYVIGKGDPAYEAYLKELIKQKNLESNVEFLGFVSEEKKYEILAQCHFLLHPSYKEGFGLTVLEAGLVGTPAIVLSGSSLDELISDGVDGYIADNEHQMAQRFIEASQERVCQELREKTGDKALKFDWGRILPASDSITQI